MDRETPTFADGSKVHAVNHVGKYFAAAVPRMRHACRRPPAMARLARAGQAYSAAVDRHDHHRGRQRRRHESLSRRCTPPGQGRRARPDFIKVLFLAYPLDTTQAVRQRQRPRQEDANRHLDLALSSMSRLTNIDFSRFDRDEPIPELSTNGHQSSLSRWIGKTPREEPSANPPRRASISPERSTTSPA